MLSFIKAISWEDVFALWGKAEAHLPRWIEHYTRRGFSSWEEWRGSSVQALNPAELSWSLYEVTDPLTTVPTFHAGPFRAWIKKYYDGKETVSFSELAKIPEIQNDPIIADIIKDFPADSTLVALKVHDQVTIIEGLHRCCAVAVANEKGISLSTKLYIACADFPGDLPLLGQENSPT